MTSLGREAITALVFLIAYGALFIIVLYAYYKKLIKPRSRYTMLFLHITIRMGSQTAGLVSGIQGLSNIGAFVTYLVLGAEGYFTLILTAYRFLISWHNHNLPSKSSWLEPAQRQVHGKYPRYIKHLLSFGLGPLAIFVYRGEPMVVVHGRLLIGNILVVLGGIRLAGLNPVKPAPNFARRVQVARGMRTAGQSVFLLCCLGLVFAILRTVLGAWGKNAGNRNRGQGKLRVHKTLLLLLLACVPLTVRGVYGVLQACLFSLSYFNINNYDPTGFTPRFLAIEYLLGNTMEWLACVCMLLTFFTSRNDPGKIRVENIPVDVIT